MNEQDLRALVRDVIARHGARPATAPDATAIPLVGVRQHASHGQFALPAQSDNSCVIEPSVGCNHCGYCKSYGH